MELSGGRRLTRYPSIEPAAASDRVLIVAPHMDDETIGAGAYALDAIRAGADVFVAFLTAGDCARFSARLLHRRIDPTPADYLSVGRTRISEADEAMRILGVPRDHLFVLGYPDRGLRSMYEQPAHVVRSTSTRAEAVPYEKALSPGASYTLANLVRDIHRVLDLVSPTTVITPVPFDLHPDHSAAADIVDMAIDSSPHAPNRLGYLVHTSRFLKPLIWTPERALLPPAGMRSFTWATYGVSATAQAIKAAMLDAYKSQRPYTYLLRNAFVRSNELFFAYSPETVQVERAVTSFACAPYSPPSSF
jgi:LmbE family N-acetylglucosaminyl deacetylase